MSPDTDALTEINLNELIAAFGWQDRPLLSRPLRRLFLRPARTFARHMAEFDADMGRLGLLEAARLTQRRYVREVRVICDRPLPPGPVLALANHPGMTDTLSLFTALNRPDLKIIALESPFLTQLPHTSQRLFYVRRDNAAARTRLIRQVSTHLRNGGAALTFPAGRIEPDPDVHDGAFESLQTWTDSVGAFVRLAPETAVLPVVVRGVVWERTAKHPLLLMKRTREERERLAATFQLLAHVILQIKAVTVRVTIGQPITARALGSSDPQTMHQAVLAEMRRLLAA